MEHRRSRTRAGSARKADPAGPQLARKCPCMAADMARVEVGVAEPEWEAEWAVGWLAREHNRSGSRHAPTVKVAPGAAE